MELVIGRIPVELPALRVVVVLVSTVRAGDAGSVTAAITACSAV